MGFLPNKILRSAEIGPKNEELSFKGSAFDFLGKPVGKKKSEVNPLDNDRFFRKFLTEKERFGWDSSKRTLGEGGPDIERTWRKI